MNNIINLILWVMFAAIWAKFILKIFKQGGDSFKYYMIKYKISKQKEK